MRIHAAVYPRPKTTLCGQPLKEKWWTETKFARQPRKYNRLPVDCPKCRAAIKKAKS